jgi:hypothetical protein
VPYRGHEYARKGQERRGLTCWAMLTVVVAGKAMTAIVVRRVATNVRVRSPLTCLIGMGASAILQDVSKRDKEEKIRVKESSNTMARSAADASPAALATPPSHTASVVVQLPADPPQVSRSNANCAPTHKHSGDKCRRKYYELGIDCYRVYEIVSSVSMGTYLQQRRPQNSRGSTCM